LSDSDIDLILSGAVAPSSNNIRANANVNNEEIVEEKDGYDSDWSEVGQLINDSEKNQSEFELEEALLNEIYSQFGTIALVFYKRAKESRLLEDKNFSDIKMDLSCRITIGMDVIRFISEILRKIG
jgi:hypothetical protein